MSTPAARNFPAPDACFPGETLPRDELRLARHVLPRRSSSAGRTAPDRLRSAESAARTLPPTILRNVELSTPAARNFPAPDACFPGETLPQDKLRLARRAPSPGKTIPLDELRLSRRTASRRASSSGRTAPDRLRSAEPAALTGVLRRFYEAERPLPPLRRAASRRTSSAGRTVPDRLRSTESAARTGVLRRFYEAERPLPLLRRAASRRSSSAGRAAPDRLRSAESAARTYPRRFYGA